MARDPWASPRVILFAPPFSFHFTIHNYSDFYQFSVFLRKIFGFRFII